MVDIDEIFTAKHSGANSRSKRIRIDCERDDGGEYPTLIRFMIPYEIPSTPDGPQVQLQFDETTVRINEGEQEGTSEEEISEDEIPQEVKDKALELRKDIGNW